jgi:hypothetical protein
MMDVSSCGSGGALANAEEDNGHGVRITRGVACARAAVTALCPFGDVDVDVVKLQWEVSDS